MKPKPIPPTVLDDVLAFAEHFGLALYDWQREALGDACRRLAGTAGTRFCYRLAGLSAARGNGKSWAAAVAGVWRLLCGSPRQHILSVALDIEGARVVLEHARAIIQSHPDLAEAVEVLADGFCVRATGSRWTIASREHTSTRGQHPDLVLYDECGWAKDDELFSSLLAGQPSVADPLMLVVSTVGHRKSGPLWTVKQLAEGGDPGVFWWWSGDNLSPRVTPEFLQRQRRILLAGQYAREHGNQWIEGADAFASASDVDAAMDHGWVEQHEGRPGVEYHAFVDLGAVHDPSVIAVGHREDETIYIDVIRTFQGSREHPVSLAAVEQAIRDLAAQFHVVKVRIESWQGIAAVQALQRAGLPGVELFTPTAKTNSEEWPVLAQRLTTRTLVCFPHARLREELLGLVYEVGPTGVKVIDRGKVHQDHAVAVRGVCASLQNRVPLQIFTCAPRGPWPSGDDGERGWRHVDINQRGWLTGGGARVTDDDSRPWVD